MIDLTDVSEEELLNNDIHWLRNGIAFFPIGYDSDGAIVDAMKRKGEKGRDMPSLRLGFSIGYHEGFRFAAKYACDALGLKHRWDSVQTEIKQGGREVTKDETGFEVIEASLAELYELQRERIQREMKREHRERNALDFTTAAITEAREILSEWLWCLEAKDRARHRVEGKTKLDQPATIDI